MRNYNISQVSSSFAMNAGLTALMLSPNVYGIQNGNDFELHDQGTQYQIIGSVDSSSTSGQHFDISKPSDNFVEIISSFYGHLLSSQQSLGSDFERVLFDNLEDLYET